jgi:3-oxoacyl-[acyl-carrier-protein] synthase-3
LKEKFGIDGYFIEEKIGVKKVTRLSKEQTVAGLCTGAFEDLAKAAAFDKNETDIVVVVTQNPDSNIPHTSALVHAALGLTTSCACFDISLGCSGFVYGLSVISSMMEANGFRKGLLFTADPYSKIIDAADKNTRLLFGDAACVTLLGDKPVWRTGVFSFGTIGVLANNLHCSDGRLFMDGRGVFDFVARNIPRDVENVLKKNGLVKEDIDLFIMHQGSKYILDTLAKRMRVDTAKLPFFAGKYGNTVSSSIPIVLKDYVHDKKVKTILISGFGVGLSYASTILTKL